MQQNGTTSPRLSDEELQRFQQLMDDNEKAEKAVLAGEVTQVPMTVKRRFDILNDHLSMRMTEIEIAGVRRKRFERLLANPAEMHMCGETPESLLCKIAAEKACIKVVRPEILRLTELVMDTLAGKFGYDHKAT